MNLQEIESLLASDYGMQALNTHHINWLAGEVKRLANQNDDLLLNNASQIGSGNRAVRRIKAAAVREAVKAAAEKALKEGWHTLDSNDLLEYANQIEGAA